MSPRSIKTAAPLGALALAAAALGACTPVTAYNGFQARDEKPASMKVGEDTKSTVLSKLGSPSNRSSFGDETWYYISQVSSKSSYHKSRIEKRDVVSIRFDKDEKVAAVKTYGLTDGYKIAYDSRATPTRGRQLNWIEQILGTVGRGGLLPQDADPGNPPRRRGALASKRKAHAKKARSTLRAFCLPVPAGVRPRRTSSPAPPAAAAPRCW